VASAKRIISMRTVLLALLMAFTMRAGVARAASFDCAKAATETEKAICSDPALSALDDIPGRFDFLGEEVTTDKVNKYPQKRLPLSVQRSRGMSNPVIYNYT
jgi:hypothetical protein